MGKRKRMLAAVFSWVLLTSALGGCAGKQEMETPAQAPAQSGEETGGQENGSGQDLYIIDVMAPNTVIDNSMDTTIGKYIADEFGIGFNFVSYAGDIQEKQALMLAGGDYNEIQYMQYQNVVQQYVDAGALLNLDDYKELLPDFYERFADVIPYWRAASRDGGLYKWETQTPREVDTQLPHLDVMVRTDVLEFYGWPSLVTASDWKEFLAKAVKDFPTTYDGQATVGLTVPMAESWGLQGVVPIGYEKGETYVAVGNDYYTYNTLTEQFEDYLLNPEARESFQFFNDLYQAGILDEECFTDTADITLQKMSCGVPVAVWYMSWNNKAANQALTEAGHPEMSYIEMPFQLDSQAGQPYSTPAVYSYPYLSFGLTKNCKDPERILKFINWCCTEEGQLLLQSGIEGVHYTVEDGKRVATDLRMQCTTDVETGKKEGLMDIPPMECLPCCMTYAQDGQPYNLYDEQAYRDEIGLSERQKEAYEALGWTNSNQWWKEHFKPVDVGYAQSCALDTTSDLGKVGAKMVETRTKYTASLIMAENFETVWEELMEEYDKLDHETVIDAMNENLAGYRGGN